MFSKYDQDKTIITISKIKNNLTTIFQYVISIIIMLIIPTTYREIAIYQIGHNFIFFVYTSLKNLMRLYDYIQFSNESTNLQKG
jgi:hypothetical protein